MENLHVSPVSKNSTCSKRTSFVHNFKKSYNIIYEKGKSLLLYNTQT